MGMEMERRRGADAETAHSKSASGQRDGRTDRDAVRGKDSE